MCQLSQTPCICWHYGLPPCQPFGIWVFRGPQLRQTPCIYWHYGFLPCQPEQVSVLSSSTESEVPPNTAIIMNGCLDQKAYGSSWVLSLWNTSFILIEVFMTKLFMISQLIQLRELFICVITYHISDDYWRSILISTCQGEPSPLHWPFGFSRKIPAGLVTWVKFFQHSYYYERVFRSEISHGSYGVLRLWK